MKLYLVRHGEAEHNVSGYANAAKSNLTATGKKQAAAVAHRFKNMKIDLIISSKLERAVQTAAVIFKKQANCKIVYNELFNEWRHPSEFIEKRRDSKFITKADAEIYKHMFDRKWHYSDEENFLDFIDRVSKSIDYLSELGKENIIVVSHGMFIRMLCAVLIVQKNPHYKEWTHKYGKEVFYKIISHTMSTLSVSNTGITVVEKTVEGIWRIRTFSDFSHL